MLRKNARSDTARSPRKKMTTYAIRAAWGRPYRAGERVPWCATALRTRLLRKSSKKIWNPVGSSCSLFRPACGDRPMHAGLIVRAGRSFSDWIVRSRPWSAATFLLTTLAVAISTAGRVGLDFAGATLPYMPFVPAVVFAALLGGIPAAIFAAWLSATVVLVGFTDRPDHA